MALNDILNDIAKEVKATFEPRPVNYLAGLQGAASQSGGSQITIAAFDYSTPQAVAGISSVLDWRGDWIHAMRDSVGSPLIVLSADQDDSRAFSMRPGSTIRQAFNRARVLYTPIVQPSTNIGGIPQVSPSAMLRVAFGFGDCPFNDFGATFGSDCPVLIPASGSGVTTAQPCTAYAKFLVPPGAVISIAALYDYGLSASAPQTLQMSLVMGDSGTLPWGQTGLPEFVPESTTPYSVAINHFLLKANFLNLTVPRGVTTVTLQGVNLTTQNSLQGSFISNALLAG